MHDLANVGPGQSGSPTQGRALRHLSTYYVSGGPNWQETCQMSRFPTFFLPNSPGQVVMQV